MLSLVEVCLPAKPLSLLSLSIKATVLYWRVPELEVLKCSKSSSTSLFLLSSLSSHLKATPLKHNHQPQTTHALFGVSFPLGQPTIQPHITGSLFIPTLHVQPPWEALYPLATRTTLVSGCNPIVRFHSTICDQLFLCGLKYGGWHHSWLTICRSYAVFNVSSLRVPITYKHPVEPHSE